MCLRGMILDPERNYGFVFSDNIAFKYTPELEPLKERYMKAPGSVCPEDFKQILGNGIDIGPKIVVLSDAILSYVSDILRPSTILRLNDLKMRSQEDLKELFHFRNCKFLVLMMDINGIIRGFDVDSNMEKINEIRTNGTTISVQGSYFFNETAFSRFMDLMNWFYKPESPAYGDDVLKEALGLELKHVNETTGLVGDTLYLVKLSSEGAEWV